jgi:hypothetical protein
MADDPTDDLTGPTCGEILTPQAAAFAPSTVDVSENKGGDVVAVARTTDQ